MNDSLLIGTWNAKFGRPADDVLAAVRTFFADHDLDALAVQEFGDYYRRAKLTLPDFLEISHGEGRAEQESVVIRRKKADVPRVGFGHSVQMTRRGWFTQGGHERPPAHAGRALIGGWLGVQSTHMPVAVNWSDGRPVGPPNRVGAYLDHAVKNVRWARRQVPGQAKLIVGDFNATMSDRGVGSPHWTAVSARLSEAGSSRGPGHDFIDFGLCTGRVQAVGRFGTAGSDHGLVVLRVSR